MITKAQLLKLRKGDKIYEVRNNSLKTYTLTKKRNFKNLKFYEFRVTHRGVCKPFNQNFYVSSDWTCPLNYLDLDIAKAKKKLLTALKTELKTITEKQKEIEQKIASLSKLK